VVDQKETRMLQDRVETAQRYDGAMSRERLRSSGAIGAVRFGEAPIGGAPPPFYKRFIPYARRLRDEGHYQMAVVMAQTACEVVTEAVMDDLFARRGVPELAGPVNGLVASYSLNNDRVCPLYTALAKDS
jgi:hypothetical protein